MNTFCVDKKPGRNFGPWQALGLLSGILVLHAPAAAQDWGISPRIGIGVEADDNATLSTRTDEEVNLTGYLADIEAEISYLSDRTSFFVTPRLRWSRYNDNPEYDADDQFARWNLTHETTSNTFRFRGQYARESIRTAERDDTIFDAEEPDDFDNSDTGIVDIEGTRQKWRFRPEWRHDFSTFSSFRARFEYTSVDYDQELSLGGLDDYTDSRLRLRYERGLSDRNTGVIEVTGRSFDTIGQNRDTTGYGVLAGISRDLSPSSTLEALVGLENVDEEGIDTDPTYVVDVSLVQRLEVINIIAQYKRNISADGQGQLMARDSINLRFNRELSEKLSAGLGVRAYRTEAIEGVSAALNERDYVQLRSRFTWNLTQAVSMEADYRYTFIRRTTLGESANSNTVNVWFYWRPIPRRR